MAFYSKSLSPVEWNYEIHDKEMLAIICALEEWRHFLEGAQYLVEIWTDHKNLEYFMTVMGIKRFDHETKVKARSERQYLQAASQLCTKQVGTGEINQIIESLLKVKVQRITKTY